MNSIFDAKKVHLVGIGGISMSSIAQILAERGIQVSGSDQVESNTIKELRKSGIDVTIGHSGANIKDQDLVIFTGAVNNTNPEIICAMQKQIQVVPRTMALNDILQLHKSIIAISGTHGKTTTTSIATQIMRAQCGEISYLIGAHLYATGKAYHLANSATITVEACEYQANFLHLHPTTIVVNNIEPEHMDYYKNINQLVNTFRTFANNLPADGHLILNRDDENACRLLDHAAAITTFAVDRTADYQAKNIKYFDAAKTVFDLYIKGSYQMTLELPLMGKFNVYNALAAICACHINGADLTVVKKALKTFVNSDRRFERIGTFKGAQVISDYAHHPSEVKATIDDAAKLPDSDLCVVFQPHTYSRTANMLDDFATAFDNAKQVLITDIYAARENNIYNISSRDLAAAICKSGKKAHYIGGLDKIPEKLSEIITAKTIVIMMGAGSIDAFARQMVDKQ